MANDEPLDVCPFERSHQILRTRMPYHIMRCAKNYPHIKLKYCPYDRRHMLHPKDYDSHVKSCQAKEFSVQTTATQTVNNSTIETPGIIPVQPFVAPLDEPVEVWGVDEVSPSPLQSIQATMETQQFAAPLIGGSKNQRKKHRLVQRRLASESSSDQGEASGQDQTEQHKQENYEKTEDDGASSQSASGEQDTSDDSDEKSAKENISRPAVKAEPIVLNMTTLKIGTAKNATATERQNSDAVSNSRPRPCTFSYAAALSSKNKPHRRL